MKMAHSAMYLRLFEAFMYLKRERGINQTVLAQKVGVSQTTVSRQLSTAETGSISTEFLFRMNDAFGGIFNLDYIVNGTGSLLADDGAAPSLAPVPEPAPAAPTASDRMVELCASLASDLESVRRSLLDTVSALRIELAEARKLNASMRAALATLGHPFPDEADDVIPSIAAEPGASASDQAAASSGPSDDLKVEPKNKRK